MGMPNFEIVAREDFSDVTYLLEVRHPLMAKAARPGQFVIVMSHASGERIPLTIADFDRKKGTITLVIQAVGKTTKEMQQDCVVGTSLYGVTGPMGIPSHFDQVKKVVMERPPIEKRTMVVASSGVQSAGFQFAVLEPSTMAT